MFAYWNGEIVNNGWMHGLKLSFKYGINTNLTKKFSDNPLLWSHKRLVSC